MKKKVTRVEALPPSTLRVFFGLRSGDIDMAPLMKLEAFAPLADPNYFIKAEVDEIGGVYWPNGADLSPDWIADAAGVLVT